MSAGAFFREQGDGPAVVCLHSNAASSSQWRGLMERLAPRFRVIAADSYGAGKSPPWPAGRRASLDDETALLAPAFEAAGDSFVLVGHSYGAAVALKSALAHRSRVRAMALYEPTLFALADQRQPPPNGADGIKATVRRSLDALARGDDDEAARHFIDFWMAEGAWAAMPDARKPAIRAAIHDIGQWAHALVEEATPLEDFGALDMPVLLMRGSRSPASGHVVGEVLRDVLPHSQSIEFEGLGHMGPVTHPEPVNAAIDDFLSRL